MKGGNMHFRLHAARQGRCNQLPPTRGVKKRGFLRDREREREREISYNTVQKYVTERS